jgi:hypothetical protein
VLRSIEWWNLGLAVVLVLASALVKGTGRVVGGVATGAALACLNFHALRRLIEMITVARSKGLLAGLVGAKMLVLMAVVWLLLKLLPVDVIAFTIGLSVFFLSILVATIRLAIAQGRAAAAAEER